MVKFGDNADDGPFVLKGSDGTTDVKGKTITDGVIVIDFGASEIKDGNTDLEIVVKPSLGEERTLTVEFDAPAPPATPLASNVEFGGVTISVVSVTVTVEAKDNGALTQRDSQVTAEMEYYGDVGGLRVMFSRNLIEGPASLGPRLCEVGGTGWRNPTLSELGMLLTGPSVTVLTLTVGDGGSGGFGGPSDNLGVGTPGNANIENKVVNMTFPEATDAKDGMVAALRSSYGDSFGAGSTEFRVISGLFDNGASPLMFVYNNTSGQAALEDYTPTTQWRYALRR